MDIEVNGAAGVCLRECAAVTCHRAVPRPPTIEESGATIILGNHAGIVDDGGVAAHRSAEDSRVSTTIVNDGGVTDAGIIEEYRLPTKKTAIWPKVDEGRVVGGGII